MKINEIIIEGRHVPVIVAHDPAEAEEKFLKANKGKAGSEFDARKALKKVRNRYEVEIVGGDDYLGHHNGKKSDKKNSLLANRKKKS